MASYRFPPGSFGRSRTGMRVRWKEAKSRAVTLDLSRLKTRATLASIGSQCSCSLLRVALERKKGKID